MNADVATEVLGRTVRTRTGLPRRSRVPLTSADPFTISFSHPGFPTDTDFVRFSADGQWHTFRPVDASDQEGWTFRIGHVPVALLHPHALTVLSRESEHIWRKVVIPILAWVGGHDPQPPVLPGDVVSIEDRFVGFVDEQRARQIERIRTNIAADGERIETQESTLRSLRREVEDGTATVYRLRARVDASKARLASAEALDGAALLTSVRSGLRENLTMRFGVIESLALEHSSRSDRIEVVARTAAFKLSTTGTGPDNPFDPATKAPRDGGDVTLGPYEIRLHWSTDHCWEASVRGDCWDMRNDYIHPHVNGDSFCFGSIADDANVARANPDPLMYLSCIETLLTSYNDRDPYRRLHLWVGCDCGCNYYCDRCEGWACECPCWSCSSCNERHDPYDSAPCDYCEYCTDGCCECLRCDSCNEVVDTTCPDECRGSCCCNCDRCSSCECVMMEDDEQCSECSRGLGCCGHTDDCDNHPDNTEGE